MRDAIVVEVDEITGHAATLEDVAASYDGLEVDTAGTSAEATGHVELAGNLPAFAEFVAEVVTALAENVASTATELRGTALDMCAQEERAYDTIRSLQLPTFDGQGQVER